MDKDQYIYLDNNANSLMPHRVINEITRWFNTGNPLGFSKFAEYGRKKINSLKSIAAINPDKYETIINSGASESNAHILQLFIHSYKLPHFIVSSIEHKSILECCYEYEKSGQIELSIIPIDVAGPFYGMVDPHSVSAAIRKNTVLISIMGANNETGIINPILDIGKIASSRNIHFHSDLTQLFPKINLAKFDPEHFGLSSWSISFHKLGGPIGVGALIISRDEIKKLKDMNENLSIIFGTQNNGLRGGTENLPLIAGAYESLILSQENRDAKNSYLNFLRREFIEELAKYMDVSTITEYLRLRNRKRFRGIILITPINEKSIPNTILFAFCSDKNIKNSDVCKELRKKGIIIGVGSACNNAIKKSSASHVINAIDLPKNLHESVIRISFPDSISVKNVNIAAQEIAKYLLLV